MPKLHSEKETKERNALWMFIEEVELSFAYSYWRKYDASHGNERNILKTEFRVFGRAAFYSSLLSVRKLWDFLSATRRPRKRDIKAEDFGFRSLTSCDCSEISKIAAHLTYDGIELGRRGMPLIGNLDLVYSLCLEFFDYLENSFLQADSFSDRQMVERMNFVREEIRKVREQHKVL